MAFASPDATLAADLLSQFETSHEQETSQQHTLSQSEQPAAAWRDPGLDHHPLHDPVSRTASSGSDDSVQGAVSLSQDSSTTDEMEPPAVVQARATVGGTLDLAMPCPLCRESIVHASADIDGVLACYPCMETHVAHNGE